MEQSQNYPKLVKAEMLSTQVLRLEFDNDEIRYVTTKLRQTIIDKKHKLTGLLAVGNMSWLGNEIEISAEGELTINGKEHYSSEELYRESTDSYKEELDKYGEELKEKYSHKG
jgi:prefoldin subunit 5